MQVGDRISLTVDRPAFGGGVIGSAPDGRVVFLRGAAPGDRVEVELVEVKKRFARGQLVALTEGPDRVEAFCPHVERCGGCPWMPIPLADQRAAHAAHLKRELRDLGPTVFEPIAAVEPTRAWRSTARLHWKDGAIGYRAAGSQAVLDIEQCPVLRPPLDAMYAQVRALVGAALRGEGTLRLTADPDGASGTVAARTDTRQPAEVRQLFAALVDDAGPIHGTRLDDGAGVYAAGRVHCELDGVVHPAASFVQAHRDGNRALTAAVLDAVAAGPAGPVLELFAGSGNFTFALADAGRAVTAVEIDPQAGAALEAAAAARGLAGRVRAVVADAGRLTAAVAATHGAPTIAVLDPPRAGARRVVERLDRLGPTLRRIVYVSCNPATLGRDGRQLAGRGWRLIGARAFDLFPHTGHMEALAVFERVD